MKKDWFQSAQEYLQNIRSRLQGKTSSSPDLLEVCVFPLPNVVLIPGTGLPLHIFEERYKVMTEDLVSQKLPLAMSLAAPDASGKLKPSKICGAGEINVLHQFPDGRKEILVQGQKRLQIVQILKEKPYIRALARPVPDELFVSEQTENEVHHELSSLVRRWIFLSPQMDDNYIRYVDFFSKPHQMADFIASVFLPTGEAKQKFLEKTSRAERVSEIMEFIEGRIALLQEKDFNNLAAWSPSQRVVH